MPDDDCEPSLPILIGPFTNVESAEAFMRGRVARGRWDLVPITPPSELD